MLEREDHFIFADGLEPATTATTADGQGEEPIATDGPDLETKNHLGGFLGIDAADLDEALDLAAQASKGRRGTVEVRPFQSDESLQALRKNWRRTSDELPQLNLKP